MKLSNKTRKAIARCAEDIRVILDKLGGTFSESANESLDEVYGLAVKIGLLTSKETYGERGSKRSAKAARRKGPNLL